MGMVVEFQLLISYSHICMCLNLRYIIGCNRMMLFLSAIINLLVVTIVTRLNIIFIYLLFMIIQLYVYICPPPPLPGVT